MDRRLLLGAIVLALLAGCGRSAAPPGEAAAPPDSRAPVREPVEPMAAGDAELPDVPELPERSDPAGEPEVAGDPQVTGELELLPPELAEQVPAGEPAPASEAWLPAKSTADDSAAIGDEPPVAPRSTIPPDSVLPDSVPPDSTSGTQLPRTAPPTRSSPGGGPSRLPPVVDKGFTRVRVFYGTDRCRGADTPNEFYNDQRRPEAARSDLELGSCDVSIPYKHTPGEIERPSIWRFEFREQPDRHVTLLDVRPLTSNRWQNEVRESLSESDERAAMVFVHGFNVDFAAAARRTAQMKYDLGFSGAAILYSWPAPSNYVECEGNAIWTLPHLMEFLTEHVHKSGAKSIHLIAHSMGTRVLTSALKELAASPDAEPIRYNQIVLAAPDIDADVFKRQIAPRIIGAAERISIYSSSKDLALVASKKVHRYTRLGEGGEFLTTFPEWPQIEVLDASNVDESLLGHSYYGDSPTILRDVRGVLKGLAATARGLRAQADYYLFHSKRTLLSERPR
jgi:esterase/lipase superfamily enzyme